MTEAEAVSEQAVWNRESQGGWEVGIVGGGGAAPTYPLLYLKISATGYRLKPVKDQAPARVGEELGQKYYQRKDKCTL